MTNYETIASLLSKLNDKDLARLSEIVAAMGTTRSQKTKSSVKTTKAVAKASQPKAEKKEPKPVRSKPAVVDNEVINTAIELYFFGAVGTKAKWNDRIYLPVGKVFPRFNGKWVKVYWDCKSQTLCAKKDEFHQEQNKKALAFFAEIVRKVVDEPVRYSELRWTAPSQPKAEKKDAERFEVDFN